jgi:hypothetical protein
MNLNTVPKMGPPGTVCTAFAKERNFARTLHLKPSRVHSVRVLRIKTQIKNQNRKHP